MDLSTLWFYGLIAAVAVLVVGWSVFFLRGKNAPLKRKVWRFGVPVIAAAFGLLVVGTDRSPSAFFIATVMIAIITFVNLRQVKFCDACGATLYNSNWFRAMPTCPHCGASLAPSAPRENRQDSRRRPEGSRGSRPS